MLNANKMNKRKLITQTQIINVIFILYLNCITAIIGIKQYDNKKDTNNINSNLDKNLQKNLDDLFTLLNSTSINIQSYTYNTSDVSNSNPVTVRSYDTSYYNLSKHLEQSLNNSHLLKKHSRIFSFVEPSQFPYKFENRSLIHNTTSESQFNISNFNQFNHYVSNETSAQMRKILASDEITITVNTTVNTTTVIPISEFDKAYLNLKLKNITNEAKGNYTNESRETLVLPKIFPMNFTKSTDNITISKDNSTVSDADSTVSPPIDSNNTLTKVLSCPNDCSSKGICVKGHCYCAQGYTSKDCSITYEEDIQQGIKIQSYVKWLIIAFFIAFGVTAGVLTWIFFKKARAGDYLELD